MDSDVVGSSSLFPLEHGQTHKLPDATENCTRDMSIEAGVEIGNETHCLL